MNCAITIGVCAVCRADVLDSRSNSERVWLTYSPGESILARARFARNGVEPLPYSSAARTRIDASASIGLEAGTSVSRSVVLRTTEPTVPRDAINAAIRIQSIVELRSSNQKKR